MKRKIITIGISLLIIAAAIFSSLVLVGNKAGAPKNNHAHTVLNVLATKAQNEVHEAVVSYSGRIGSFDNVALAAEVSGKILQGDVPFKEGQSFRKGDLLIKIYEKDAQASIKASKSNFLRNLSQILPDIKVDYADEFPKWEAFFNAIDLERKLPELPTSKNETFRVFLAAQGVLSDYYSLQQQEIQLSKYKLYAPFDGYFKNVYREVGAIAGGNSSLADIIRSDKLEINVPVTPSDAKKIRIGQEVSFGTGNSSAQAVVSRKAGFVDAATQSVNIYITYLPAKNNTFLEGEYVDVFFDMNENEKVVKVARESIFDTDHVFVVENGKLKQKQIEISQQLGDFALICGLNDGEIVVTESLINAKDGQEVSVRNN